MCAHDIWRVAHPSMPWYCELTWKLRSIENSWKQLGCTQNSAPIMGMILHRSVWSTTWALFEVCGEIPEMQNYRDLKTVQSAWGDDLDQLTNLLFFFFGGGGAQRTLVLLGQVRNTHLQVVCCFNTSLVTLLFFFFFSVFACVCTCKCGHMRALVWKCA